MGFQDVLDIARANRAATTIPSRAFSERCRITMAFCYTCEEMLFYAEDVGWHHRRHPDHEIRNTFNGALILR
jgi:hypothetical protein